MTDKKPTPTDLLREAVSGLEDQVEALQDRVEVLERELQSARQGQPRRDPQSPL